MKRRTNVVEWWEGAPDLGRPFFFSSEAARFAERVKRFFSPRGERSGRHGPAPRNSSAPTSTSATSSTSARPSKRSARRDHRERIQDRDHGDLRAHDEHDPREGGSRHVARGAPHGRAGLFLVN